MSLLPLVLCLLAADASTASRLYTEGRFQEAAAQYAQILRDSPLSVEAMLGMGKALIALRVPRQALPYVLRARQLDSGNWDVRRTLAHALAESNQFFQAETLLKELTGADPKDGESWYYLGSLYYRSGYYGSALPALEHAVAAQPDNSQAAIYRAVCLAKLGHSGEAEKSFLRLLANPANERDPDLLLTYAELLYESRRSQEALSRVEQMLRANPDSAIAHFWKAKILFGTDRAKEAAKEAEEAVRMAPEFPFSRILLMNIYEALGRPDEAAVQAEWLRRHEQK